jgi:hypothetical protein
MGYGREEINNLMGICMAAETKESLMAKAKADYEAAIGPEAMAHITTVREDLQKGDYSGAAKESAKGFGASMKYKAMHPLDSIKHEVDGRVNDVQALFTPSAADSGKTQKSR